MPPQHRFTGKVKRIYSHTDATRYWLDITLDPTPLENYFVLQLNHPNYNALYSLALSAAINGYTLTIRTEKDTVKDEPAIVLYMVVDW